MASSDVTIQDGDGAAKLHPYLITLVRWMVSCVWSTASVLLHRLLTAPLPAVTASRQTARPSPKPRSAGTAHLHPEPLVECVTLHTPRTHSLDVIFVHGLYGSLGNTWRQGDWRTKYKLDPTKVPLREHSAPCSCEHRDQPQYSLQQVYYETNIEENKNISFSQFNGCFQKILPNENALITENFYNNTLLDVDNYETQAQFVSELFKNDCDNRCDLNTVNCSVEDGIKCNYSEKCSDDKCRCLNEKCKLSECRCKKRAEPCEAGCGCVCDDCYSPCWPRDWIKEDFPEARVISINYTSDPYLWRPLWVKGNKRLRLHERAEQMIEQLLALGVGERPVVWVGHSKGGLFIKQIYCEAYEAHLKLEKNKTEGQNNINNNTDQSNRQYNIANTIDNKYKSFNDKYEETNEKHFANNFMNDDFCTKNNNNLRSLRNIDEMNEIRNNNNSGDNNVGCHGNGVVRDAGGEARCEEESADVREGAGDETSCDVSSSNKEDMSLSRRASLWRSSCGFMFYSVPHRGSPLAHIKTPITTRSIELLEIAKDCPLVLGLQSSWLAAARAARPAVRSLVETRRTLMSVLWLTIVSEDSADAGVGSLAGVSVDHREICKPAGRACPLYRELARLVTDALHTTRCARPR
ncbi:uncharacterized protein LOC113506260 [Trichoplusia ni]|uniref:Uncharacterized protein LOC113506260 n=1 Tax=Trichoplusia ni TaxID=7111 RepID=A0A7E5WVN4_TRINI|nr:uncharacterized protein LOC113506260 [Trichoplusia ni]